MESYAYFMVDQASIVTLKMAQAAEQPKRVSCETNSHFLIVVRTLA